MKPHDTTPRPQAAAVPPSDKQRRFDTLKRAAAAYELSSGNPVIDRLRFLYALMSYFHESDFTLEGHKRRRGYLELIVSQMEEALRAGNAGLVTDIQFVLVPIMDGGQS